MLGNAVAKANLDTDSDGKTDTDRDTDRQTDRQIHDPHGEMYDVLFEHSASKKQT